MLARAHFLNSDEHQRSKKEVLRTGLLGSHPRKECFGQYVAQRSYPEFVSRLRLMIRVDEYLGLVTLTKGPCDPAQLTAHERRTLDPRDLRGVSSDPPSNKQIP